MSKRCRALLNSLQTYRRSRCPKRCVCPARSTAPRRTSMVTVLTLRAGARASRTCTIALQQKARDTTMMIGSGARGPGDSYMGMVCEPSANASIAPPPPLRPSSSPMSGEERAGMVHDLLIRMARDLMQNYSVNKLFRLE